MPARIATVIVVTGGSPLPDGIAERLPPDAYIIAADSGLDHAFAAGLHVDLVVGDLDSVSAEGLARARADGITIDEHPADKDATDTELAIAVAVQRGADELLLIGGGGDRLDHSMGAIVALGHPALAGLRAVSASWGDAEIAVLHAPRRRTFTLDSPATFSLLALHGPCTGVFLAGARWPLNDAVIEPASSLGVSNVAVTGSLAVSVATGVLTVIFPDHQGDPS